MLSDKKIKDAIKNKEIEILISFIKKNGVPTLLDKEKNILDTDMKNQIYSDRLKLTMGPVVKVLKKDISILNTDSNLIMIALIWKNQTISTF